MPVHFPAWVDTHTKSSTELGYFRVGQNVGVVRAGCTHWKPSLLHEVVRVGVAVGQLGAGDLAAEVEVSDGEEGAARLSLGEQGDLASV